MVAQTIDEAALSSMSVAPGDPKEDRVTANRSDAGTDLSITERLERNPESKEARLDRALDESMDASDPPSSTQPVHSHSAPVSSGYDPKHEAKLAAAKRAEGKGVLGKLAVKLGLA